MLLVTGIPGWLGNRFIEILLYEDQHSWSREFRLEKIRCLVLPGTRNAFTEKIAGKVELIEGDVTKKDSLAGFFKGSAGATLFHFAGIIHPRRKVGEFYRVNAEGTYNILEMAREHLIKKVVVLSSNSQSGVNLGPEHSFTEDSPYNPYLNYGKSKMIMEKIVDKFFASYGLDCVTIRTCWFFGPHQPKRQSRFFGLVKDGLFPLIGDGSNRRSLSYVDDVCQGLLLAAGSRVSSGKKYWIASEKAYTMREIIDTTREVMEREFGFRVKPIRLRLPSLVGAAAYLADALIQSIGFYQQEIHVLSEMNKSIACSIDLAKNELGYKPLVSLYDGIKKSIGWCLENGQVI